jgi:gag-polypeptide of LTR copia-type/GAG-pre-integrase domain
LPKIQRSFRRKSLEPLYFSHSIMSNKSIPDATLSDGNDPVADTTEHIYKMKTRDSPTAVKMPEHLDENNWAAWRQCMTKSLKFYNVEGYLHGIPARPSDADDVDDLENWEHSDSFVQTVITLNIKPSEMAHISRCETAAAMWSSLKAVHESSGHLTAMIMKRNLLQTRAKEGDDIGKHLAKMKEDWEQICQMDTKRTIIDDASFKEILALSLPRSWDGFTQPYINGEEGVDNPRSKGLISSQKFIGLLRQEYIQRKLRAQPAESASQAIQKKPNLANRIGKGKPAPRGGQGASHAEKPKGSCSHCGRGNHATDKCYFLGKTKCDTCGKFTHATKDCWGKKRKDGDGEASASASKKAKVEETHAVVEDIMDAFIEEVDEEDAIFATEYQHGAVFDDEENNFDSVACNFDQSNQTLDAYDWLADSATTSHVVNKREIFTEYTPLSHASVAGVGNTKVSAEGRGTVLLEARCDGHKYNLRLEHVLHIPSNRNNLLSLGRWSAAGGTFANTGDMLRLTTKDGKTVAEGERKENNLFMMRVKVRETKGSQKSEAAFATTEKPESWETWHKRFGHVSYSGLQKLLAENLVDGFNVDTQSPKPDCIACTEAKQTEDVSIIQSKVGQLLI